MTWRAVIGRVLPSPLNSLASAEFSKLLSKFELDKKKSKYQSYSEFQDLQLCQYKFFKFGLVFEIQLEFEKGTNLGFKPNSKLLLILYGNLKIF